MNILILGGTGNISTEVALCLARRGDNVTLLTSGKTPVPDRYSHIKANRHDKTDMHSALAKTTFDAAIDFLGYTPQHCEIAYNALQGKIGHYIFISSATVYQKPHTILPLTEDMPLGNPFSEYARRKIACEQFLQTVHAQRFPLTIVRPSHTFGKTWIPSPLHGADWTVAARILDGRPVVVHDTGQSLWTLTAASDFAEAVSGITCNDNALGEAFHITSDQPLTWNAIYFEIGAAFGAEPEIVHIPTDFLTAHIPEAAAKLSGDKAQHGVFDNTKIKKLCPEWECRKSFRMAIRESVDWYNEDTSRKIVDREKDKQIDVLIQKWRS
jgi:nucleoside-diphosphate-sugar epimerase